MNQSFAPGIFFLVATLAAFGLLYVVDQSFNGKWSGNQYPMLEIKGSVGAVSPIEKPVAPATSTRPATSGDHATTTNRDHVDAHQ